MRPTGAPRKYLPTLFKLSPVALARCLHRARQGSGRVAQIRTILSDEANPHGVAAVLRDLLVLQQRCVDR
eukprot:949175-Heterocapsa_arctica.AAC.1